MELRQMKYFITIANTRSYSDAAKSLFVTQPTLSWNMQKLEEELNVNLFDKSDHDISLTKLGQIFYDESIKVLENVDNLLKKMREEDRKENQKLKVGLTVLFAVQYMDQIVHFTTSNPDVELSFIQSGSIKLQKMLANKEIDIGLISFPIYEPSITIQHLKTSHSNYSVSVVVPFDHPLANKKTIKIADLKNYAICSLSESYVIGKVMKERCQEHGFQPNIIFTNGNWEVLLQNTITTGALTLLPKALEKLSNFYNLKWIPLDDKANYFEIGIAKRKDEYLNSAAIKFIDHIKSN